MANIKFEENLLTYVSCLLLAFNRLLAYLVTEKMTDDDRTQVTEKIITFFLNKNERA